MILVQLFQTSGSFKNRPKEKDNYSNSLYLFNPSQSKTLSKYDRCIKDIVNSIRFADIFLLFTTITATTYILVFKLAFVFIKALWSKICKHF